MTLGDWKKRCYQGNEKIKVQKGTHSYIMGTERNGKEFSLTYQAVKKDFLNAVL